MSKKRVHWLGAIALLAMACGSNEANDDDLALLCLPDQTQSCECASSEPGQRTCLEDRSGWGECVCESGDPCGALACDFGCEEGSCFPDPCTLVECEFGCADGACLSGVAQREMEIDELGRFTWSEASDRPMEGISFETMDAPTSLIWEGEEDWLGVGPALDASPEGMRFDPLANLEFRLDPASREALGALVDDLVVRHESGDSVEYLHGTWIDPETFSVEVTHFSAFAMGVPGLKKNCEAQKPGACDKIVDFCGQGGAWACDILLDLCVNGMTTMCDSLVAILCGNGVVDALEACDDGNVVSGDGCNDLCELEICGNGILDVGEQCDDGGVATGDGCNASCLLEFCGDGVVQPSEACDDGNAISGDGCDANCALEICGDGIVQVGEVCDDANGSNNDFCLNDCSRNLCNDGYEFTGVEACDSGLLCGLPGECACDCTGIVPLPVCGDGVVDAGETCDDGIFCGLPNQCACDCSGSTPPICGNVVVEAGEVCDDGQLCGQPGRCVCSCLGYPSATCGNGFVEAGEVCDDDNTVSGDGCEADCLSYTDLYCHVDTGISCMGRGCPSLPCPPGASPVHIPNTPYSNDHFCEGTIAQFSADFPSCITDADCADAWGQGTVGICAQFTSGRHCFPQYMDPRHAAGGCPRGYPALGIACTLEINPTCVETGLSYSLVYGHPCDAIIFDGWIGPMTSYGWAFVSCSPNCGDGVLDWGELCDDGALNGSAPGDCNSSCTGYVP